VLPAIEFDRKAQRGAIEIKEIWSRWMLPAKIDTKLAASQAPPEARLNIS
jgi:hypothetical protein